MRIIDHAQTFFFLEVAFPEENFLKVTVDLRGVFWGKQYSALCINGKYINLYIIGELFSLATRLC